MQLIPLQAIPNQSFTIVLDNNEWSFTIKITNGIMSVSLLLNNNLIIQNVRTVANEKIIPSIYEESGNFLFLTQNFQLPDYTQFGITQTLVYVNAAELAAFRAAPTLPITAADFNPIAALPLRFAPTGYINSPVAGMALRLDASTTDVGILAAWPDTSGNSYNATQSTAGFRPVCTANQLNGRNTVVFTAANSQRMVLPSDLYPMFNSNYTVFCVSKANDATTQFRLYTASEAGSSKALLNYTATTSTSTFGAQNSFNGIVSNAFTRTSPAIISAFRNGIGVSIAINNGAAVTDVTGVSSPSIDNITLGSRVDGSLPLDGYIAEMIWYPSVLTADQIYQNNYYLSTKWDVPLV